MSYAALGTNDSSEGLVPWNVQAAELDEAYVWRGFVHATNPRSIGDVQAIARALAENADLRLDLRGVAMDRAGPADLWQIDAVFTSQFPQFYLTEPIGGRPLSYGQAVVAALQERFPGAALQAASFLQFVDEPKHPALDFWLNTPVIWARWMGPPTGAGQPTTAFAEFRGLYRGSAEQGHGLQPWPKQEPGGLVPPSQQPEDTTLLWVIGGIAIAWLVGGTLKQGAGA